MRRVEVSPRRFDRRYRHMLWEVKLKRRDPADLTMRVRAWGAHVRDPTTEPRRRQKP